MRPEPKDPYEIRLIVTRQPDGAYQAVWEDAGHQRSEPFPFRLPLSAEDRDELRWYLEEYSQFVGAGDKARAREVEQKLEDWGRALFEAVFGAGEARQVYNNLMQAVGEGSPGYLTVADTAPEVLVQPWELLRDRRGPLALQGVTIRRQLTGADRRRKMPELKPPLRVLLIVARPKDVGFIDPRNSIPPLLDALEALPGQVEVDFCEPPTLPALEARLAESRRDGRPYAIVHFDGHGTYLPESGIGALVFEDAGEKKDLVTGRQMGDLLARHSVPLVVLEACRGADLSDRPVFGSLAPALLQAGVGSVIAFSHSVHVYAARLLVERFYRELAGGRTVGQALEEARAALRADPQRWLARGPNPPTVSLQDWFIAQLYQVGDDPALFRRRQKKAATPAAEAARQAPVFANFPPRPIYAFYGRARELLALERKFRTQPAVVVAGMGGMGKTALAREAAAWWLRTGRFAGAVFTTFEQYATAEQAALGLGTALEGPEFSALPAAEQMRRAVELFHTRPLLWVWDNFESTLAQFDQPAAPGTGETPHDEVESPLSFGAQARERLLGLYRALVEPPDGKLPQGRLLVTCRPLASGLPGIGELELEGLAEADALHLLSAVLERKNIPTERVGYDPAALKGLLHALGYHPLSIELVAPHLKEHDPAEIRREFNGLLARFADAGAYEGRNRSLLASLEFSRRRLSQAAQAALPGLGWFEGGVFERGFLAFAQMEEAQWQPLRAELEATALLRVEALEGFNTPYLRFHPTLAAAARLGEAADNEAALAGRFVDVYAEIGRMIDKYIFGNDPGGGMLIAGLEEANLRRAAALAFASGRRREGAAIADTLREFLERSGRRTERDRLVEWLHARVTVVGDARLDGPACDAIQQRAWGMAQRGQAQAAVEAVQELIARLEKEGLEGEAQELAFQLATANLQMGRIRLEARRPDLARPFIERAIAGYEALGEAKRGNLAAALGDLAGAYVDLGRHAQALAAAERGLAIDRALGRSREVAVGLGRVASILMAQQRYAEAEQRYSEALALAEQAGDLGLQGITMQHLGGLQHNMEHFDQAAALYRRALERFQSAGDRGGEMLTCDLLGSAEMKRGQLAAAEAWYARARELALDLGDRAQLAATAHNIGVLRRERALAADGDERAGWLRWAVESVQEGRDIRREMGDRVGTAQSLFQLGVLHLDLGDLAQAETNLREALGIFEELRLPDVYKVYYALAEVARARGDMRAAAEWQAKYETRLAEVRRLRRGEGTEAAQQAGKQREQQLFEFFLALGRACYQARASGAALDPEAAEALARVAQADPPWPEAAAYLQACAENRPLPPIPPGLPKQVRDVLEALGE